MRAEATVTAIDNRTIDFDVIAYDALEPIGRGTHRRAVVRLEKVRERVAAKIVQLPEGILLPMQIEPNAGERPKLDTLEVAEQGATLRVTLNRPAHSMPSIGP